MTRRIRGRRFGVRYIYSGWQVVEERYGWIGVFERVKKSYIYGNYIDEPVVMNIRVGRRIRRRFYYLHNSQYSVIALTDKRGRIREKYLYTPYGEVKVLGRRNRVRHRSLINDYLFTGRRYDWGTGLYYFRSRYYSGELGRFLSRDLWKKFGELHPTSGDGYKDGMNLYCGYFVVNGLDAKGLGQRCLHIYDHHETRAVWKDDICVCPSKIFPNKCWYEGGKYQIMEYDVYLNICICPKETFFTKENFLWGHWKDPGFFSGHYKDCPGRCP